MKIRANGRTIEAVAINENKAIIDGEERPTLAIAFKDGISRGDIDALTCGIIDIDDGYKVYKGFTSLVDVEVLLYRPADAELIADKAAELQKDLEAKQSTIAALAVGLSDELAVQHPEIYPIMAFDGAAIEAGTRINWQGKLMRAKVTLWDREDCAPNVTPSLWGEIETIGVLEAWAQPIGAHDAYAKGVQVIHKDKTWVSTADGNVWEPGIHGWEEATP